MFYNMYVKFVVWTIHIYGCLAFVPVLLCLVHQPKILRIKKQDVSNWDILGFLCIVGMVIKIQNLLLLVQNTPMSSDWCASDLTL